MRHRKGGTVLGRDSAHRKAMFRNMVTSLLEHERIETTDAKAKEVRRIAEKMITLGKRGDLHARRQALRVIRSKAVTAKLFDELADRFRDLADVLAAVCDHVCPRGPDAVAGLYRLYVESGSECDRRRLLRLGRNLPARSESEHWQ